jgi:hypothetical protein
VKTNSYHPRPALIPSTSRLLLLSASLLQMI